jgi:hypothetical protein
VVARPTARWEHSSAAGALDRRSHTRTCGWLFDLHFRSANPNATPDVVVGLAPAGRPDQQRGGRRLGSLVGHASNSQVCVRLAADQAGSKHVGESRNRAKAGPRTGRSRRRVAGDAVGCASGDEQERNPSRRVVSALVAEGCVRGSAHGVHLYPVASHPLCEAPSGDSIVVGPRSARGLFGVDVR